MIKTRPSISDIDFNQSPFLVIWEVTQACDLACRHCRAEARPERRPDELSTEEGYQLLHEVLSFGLPSPLLVLTGGDPLKRSDVYDLIRYGVNLSLRVAMTPSGTPLITYGAVFKLKDAGLSRLAVSLDGSKAEIHDAFRGVSGSFDWTMNGIRYAHEVGLPLQVNTTVTRYNLNDFDEMAQMMAKLGIVLWSVFLLVPTGRGKKEDEIKPQEYENIFHKLYELSKTALFDIKTTEAPHYRRVVAQRLALESFTSFEDRLHEGMAEEAGKMKEKRIIGTANPYGVTRAASGVNAGKGFIFVSHTGEVYPSGFLPLSAGNVREQSLVTIYRESPLLKELRDYSKLKGKCGYCEYRDLCGGSRSRAYALTGDYLAPEPYCVYRPSGR